MAMGVLRQKYIGRLSDYTNTKACGVRSEVFAVRARRRLSLRVEAGLRRCYYWYGDAR